MSASEKQFEDLRRMIHCLDKPRYDHFMRCLQLPANGVPPAKSIGIVSFLKKNKDAGMQETFLANYKGSNKSTFMKQVIRIKEKLFSSILDDENIHRSGSYTACTRAIIEVRKNTMIAKLFPSLTFEGNLLAFLNRNIAKAKKFELFDELIELLNYKYQYVASRYGIPKSKAIAIEIDYINATKSATMIAMRYDFLYTGIVNSQSTFSKKMLDLNSIICELESYSHKFHSAILEFYLIKFRINNMLHQRDFHQANEMLKSLFDFKNKNHEIINSGIMVSIDLILAQINLFNYKFSEALICISRAKTIKGTSLFNAMLISLIEFNHWFYLGIIDLSKKISSKLTLDSASYQANYFKNLFSVLKSILLFLDRNYRETNKLLTDLPEFEKDKAGWNLGVRLLRIMNFIEMDKLDTAELHIESMRKHIERTEKSGIKVRKRDKTILKILIELVKQDFNFQKTLAKKADLIALLGSTEFEYCWEMMKHEMIVFHVWFKAKAEGKEYDPNILNHPKEVVVIGNS